MAWLEKILPTMLLAGAMTFGAWSLLSAGETTIHKTASPMDPFVLLAGEGVSDRTWVEDKLEKFEAEANADQSVYLSLVQLTELERSRGDLSKATPVLKDVATRAAKQQLRNATNRLLYEIYMELGEAEKARDILLTIIEESLAQR